MEAKNSTDEPKATRNASVEGLDTSDQALTVLLTQLKTSADPKEIDELSHQVERVIFHKQFEAARITLVVELRVTPNDLTEIFLVLTKTERGSDIRWTITFELLERTSPTASFAQKASLTVGVDPVLNTEAEKTYKGLTQAQTAQASGPAASAVKAAHANPALMPLAEREIQKVLQCA